MKAIEKMRPSVLQGILAALCASVLLFAGCKAMAEEPITPPAGEGLSIDLQLGVPVSPDEEHDDGEGFIEYLKGKFGEIKEEYHRLTTDTEAAEEGAEEGVVEDAPSVDADIPSA